MARLGGIWLEIRAKQDKLKSDFRDAKRTVSQTADEMESRLRTFGIAAAASVGALGFAAIRVGTEFEKNMKTVQAFSGATGEDLERLTAIAREMGATTEFSATEAAQGLQFLAAAGLTVQQQLAALPGVIDLATASQVDLATATDISTDTMTAFGLEVENLNQVSDALINTTSRTNTNLLQLGEAMKFVAPVAGQMGISVERTSATLGVLANSGLKASLGGTSLRSVLLSVDKAAKKLGLEGAATLTDVLKEMERQQTSTTEQTAIFGKIATTGVGILRNNIDRVEELTEALLDNQGATGTLAGIMRDSLGVEIKTLGSTIEENLLKVFDIFKDDASIIVGNLTDITREVGKWIDANDELIRSKVVDSIKAFGTSVLNIATFVNKNPDILKWGLFGFAIFGRKGAALGAIFGKVVDLTDSFSKNLGKVSISALGVREALIASAALTYAEGLEEASDKTRTFAITNQETGESLEKTDGLLDGLVTTMLNAVDSADSLTDSVDSLGDSQEEAKDEIESTIPVVENLVEKVKEATNELNFFQESIDELGVEGFVALDKESRSFFENLSAGWNGAQGDVETWADLAIDLGKTASREIENAFSNNLFDIMTGNFDNLGDAWEGVMSSMLKSFTDGIATMALQSGALTALATNPLTQIAAATVAFGFVVDNVVDSIAGTIGSALGVFASKNLGIQVGSERGFGKLTFEEGEFGGTLRTGERRGLREGRFIFPVDFAEEQSQDIKDAVVGIFFDLENELTESFNNFPVQGFGEIVSDKLSQIPIEIDADVSGITVENFEEKFGEVTEDIREGVGEAYDTALIQAGLSLGIISIDFRDNMLDAIDEWLQKMERAAELSGATIGNAFRAGLETGDFLDFGNSIREQVFNSVFEGMITALTQSEVYRQALQPIFAGIEDAFDVSFDTGNFDPEVFTNAIQPVLDGLTPAIDALEPAFTAVNDVLDTVNEAIFGPQAQALDDIDLTLSDLTTISETGSNQIVNSVDSLGGKIEELASRPINVTAVSVVDVQSLDSRIEDIVVDREDDGLTEGERTVTL